MTDSLNIAMAQLNPVVGDLDGNAERLLAAWREAAAAGYDLLVAPELYISGYPPEDLVMRRAFQAAVVSQVERISRITAAGGPWIVTGAPWVMHERLYNAALVIGEGEVKAVSRKRELPNYGVFDELRVFSPGPLPEPVDLKHGRAGMLVCEDMWVPEPSAACKAAGAEILIVINGSPFDAAKAADREMHARRRVDETGLPLVYVNQTGGQDELVFDGTSFAMSAAGKILCRARSWRVETVGVRFTRTERIWRGRAGKKRPVADALEMTYSALVVGLRDYAGKNGFKQIVLGLSGGVDSALCAAIAVDALGPDSVQCVMLPSQFTSKASVADAADCAKRLGVQITSMPINTAVAAFEKLLANAFQDLPRDVAEENIQARARAIVLMAISNKFNHMLLTTGNKSELSVGYATLYGDMSGGFSVLKDVYKTQVYELARWRNEHAPPCALGPAGPVIPDNVLTKAPTAELHPNQKDSDTLPPYDKLDEILRGIVDDERSVKELVGMGHNAALVARVEGMVYAAEYKRRQAAPGVRISRRNFGRDRRYPITNRFREGER
jgi:NAD+ synthase